jgi:hypothetical protein
VPEFDPEVGRKGGEVGDLGDGPEPYVEQDTTGGIVTDPRRDQAPDLDELEQHDATGAPKPEMGTDIPQQRGTQQ